jgi:hypothetical protein
MEPKDPTTGHSRPDNGDLSDIEKLGGFDARWGAVNPIFILEIWPQKKHEKVRGTKLFKYEGGTKT